MEYYRVIKINEIMPLAATWMDLEIIRLSDVSQTEINTIFHLYMESKKMIPMILFIKQKLSHRTRKQIVEAYAYWGSRGKDKIRDLGLTDTYYYI